MKTIFFIITIVAIAAAAVFTTHSKAKFQEQQTMRINAIQQNKRVVNSADKAMGELNSAKEALTRAKGAVAELGEGSSVLLSTTRELETEKARVQSQLEAQAGTLAEAEKARQPLDDKLEQMGLQGADLNDKFTELQVARDSMTGQIEELETNIEGAEAAIAKNREEITRLADKQAARTNRFRTSSKESVITAVDQNWGFVVIGAGRSSGFEPKRRLIVKRDGRMIAEVTPSSVESSQTIAEIDFDTVAPGVRLQPGDRVLVTTP